MSNQKLIIFILLAQFFSPSNASEENLKVLSFESVKWGYLNPLRGDKSPGAADLWGDRTSDKATGMLVRFNDGFSSPPHIHNVSYRGIVIFGALHNDDPEAEKKWLTPGSFWTQPAGGSHITAANGAYNLAYVEIDSGPYLVKPVDHAFDNDEKPINIEASNIPWILASDLSWVQLNYTKDKHKPPKVAYLWGTKQENKLNGLMIKFPSQMKVKILSQEDVFKAVIVKGSINYKDKQKLTPGSLFSSFLAHTHQFSTDKEETVIYIRTKGQIQVEIE